jgi:glycine/D-amino acid oxidase-like deaminating enzyme/nitrite reductase/ring-hydroxylating ferredoxin subunit
VCVIGAGIVGITTALLLKRAGKRVILLETDQVIRGTTGYTTAKVTSGHGVVYSELEKKHGRQTAAAYARANEAGLAKIRELAQGIDCDLETKANYVYSESPEEADSIREEVEAAQRAGLPASLVTQTDLPYPVAAAIRQENQAQFHPVKYLIPLAKQIEGDGSYVFDRTRATGVEEGSPCSVITEQGSVTCEDVVVATNYPFLDRGLFFPRVHPKRSYCISGSVADDKLVEGMYISTDQPTRSVRTIRDGDRTLMLIGGEGHNVGQEQDTEKHYRNLESWAREHFGMTEVTHRWSTQDGAPVDDLPYVGTLRRSADHLYVATGFKKWGMTNGTIAAVLINDLILGRDNEFADLYDPHRVTVGASATSFVEENVKVGKKMIGDRIAHPQRGGADDLGPGEAAVVGVGTNQVAAYRDESGTLHAVSAVCTHLGCIVNWNAAEKTWDCPCHGSRFGFDGGVIHGPAVQDLEKKDL